MKNNFDLKKFLVENKLTTNSRQLTERNDIVPTRDLEVSAAFKEAGIDMSRPVLVLTMDGGHGEQKAEGIISTQKALIMFQRLRAAGREREDHYEFDNELEFHYEGYEYKLAYFEQESTSTALMQKIE